ncbi:hypothetical protein CH376_00045 [Leptospira adleri]|uniref:Uncharacterized protein n=1 Tax=Leptospira adleri TaxID=2023186 RepID=A0ABX4P454_9LEPT|nr:hypothetical protein CH376_00045 [Leptospira adleri]
MNRTFCPSPSGRTRAIFQTNEMSGRLTMTSKVNGKGKRINSLLMKRFSCDDSKLLWIFKR